MRRHVGPVVTPAYDYVALVGTMAVFCEIPTLELELNAHTLPLPGRYLAFRFAVWKTRLHRLDKETELTSDHAEQEYGAALIHSSMP